MGMGRTGLTVGRIERAREALRLVICARQTAGKYSEALPALILADRVLETMQKSEQGEGRGQSE